MKEFKTLIGLARVCDFSQVGRKASPSHRDWVWEGLPEENCWLLAAEGKKIQGLAYCNTRIFFLAPCLSTRVVALESALSSETSKKCGH